MLAHFAWIGFLVLQLILSPLAQAKDQPHLTIGLVLPLSGSQATYGEHSVQAIDLAFEKLKQSDPDIASRIRIIKEDDKSNPIDAVTAVKKLLHVNKVDLVLGSISSSNTLAMIAATIEAKKPLVTFASTNPEITSKAPWVFRTCFSDPFQGKILATYALEHLHKKHAAILFDHKSDYSTGLRDVFSENFVKEGGKIVAQEAYESGKKDFRIQLTKIKAKKPDVLFVPGYFQEVGLIMKQAHSIGLKVTMLGADGWDNANLFEIATPEAAREHYYSSHFSVDDQDPLVQAFVREYSLKYEKPPVSMAAMGYDGFLAVVDAFKRARSNDAGKMAAALGELRNFKGVAGTMSLNQNRDAEKETAILRTDGTRAVFAAKIAPRTAAASGK